jgi:hypothetical protein
MKTGYDVSTWIDPTSGCFPVPPRELLVGAAQLTSEELQRELAVLTASLDGLEGLAALCETTTTREGR